MSHVQLDLGDQGNTSAAVQDLARLWACRLLLNGRGYRALGTRRMRLDEDMCVFVGLDPERVREDQGYVRRRLRTMLKRLGTRLPQWPWPLRTRLDELGAHLSLDAMERQVLAFLVLATGSEELQDAAKMTASRGQLEYEDLVACALDQERGAIEHALSPRGHLARSGLVQMAGHGGGRRGQRLTDDVSAPALELLSGLGNTLVSRAGSVERFLATYFQQVVTEDAASLDFSHCAEEASRLGALLEHALTASEPGVNILVHGDPGVGKTEFIRYLARNNGWDLYAVSDSDSEGESLTGRRRFKAYQLCQFLLAERERGVLMFDEIEDVFDPRFVGLPDRSGPLGERGSTGKAWTNRLLESNPRPVIWISNETNALDPAYLRRFDYILRLDAPPRSVRRRMLGDATAGTTLPTHWLDARAAETDMTPARIAQLGRLAQRLEPIVGCVELPEVLDTQLEQRRATTRGKRPTRPRRENPLEAYALEYLNTRPSAGSLLAGLQRRKQGTVLMHGPPGTGKTAFAEYAAEQLGCELVSRSASELLDKYVGETEKAIAQMFDEARSEGAVLLLDEADNFLQARSGAQQHWETTQTNELLVQMERFDGAFLCATNLLELLDSAAMRRFDVKLGFSYLEPPQRWRLFEQLIEARGLACPSEAQAERLWRRIAALECLTPGDFAAIARGTALLDESIDDAAELMDRLETDHALKPDAGNGLRVGFV